MTEIKWFPAGTRDDSYEKLRVEVFVKEQGFAPEVEFDSYDKSCPHLCLFSENEAVATGRFIPYKDGVKIGRIAVRRDMRGKGLGELAVAELIKKAKADGFDKIYVGAQLQAKGFYEKCGFTAEPDGEYIEENVPHIKMYKFL